MKSFRIFVDKTALILMVKVAKLASDVAYRDVSPYSISFQK